MSRYLNCVRRLQRWLSREGFEAILITRPENVTYLSGFSGEDSYLLLTATQQVALSDARFTQQWAEECPGWQACIRRPPVTMPQLLSRALRQLGVQQVGFEGDHVTVGELARWQQGMPRIAFQPMQHIVENLRLLKDASEQRRIRRAVQVAQQALEKVLQSISPEMTERDVACELEYRIRQLGGDGCSFPPIVAAGPRAALPHARPTTQRLGDADFVLIDWGARVGGYVSDLTRVFAIAKISPKLQRIYDIVRRAQQRAVAAIRPGVTAGDLDDIARRVITDAGFGKRFGHSLGHGIGLAVHESPRLAARQTLVLEAGMVITVEPGIYLPGWGGVRIEDDVLVTREGREVLSSRAPPSPVCLFSP